MAYGQTVLSRIAQVSGLPWDNDEAHSALYDARMTAEIFCKILNTWNHKVENMIPMSNPGLINEEQEQEQEQNS